MFALAQKSGTLLGNPLMAMPAICASAGAGHMSNPTRTGAAAARAIRQLY
jgi:hypothetical protein